jgi:hypothetical protein
MDYPNSQDYVLPHPHKFTTLSFTEHYITTTFFEQVNKHYSLN